MTLKPASGFSLIEMSIVLAIIALLLGTGLTLFSTQQDQQRISDTGQLLNDAREMLTGYALSHTAADGHPYLPCPDRTSGNSGSNLPNDGLEDRTAGICDMQEGNLPWATLGMSPQTDAWSNRLRYRVSAAFSGSNTGIVLTSVGDIGVQDASAGGNIVASTVPAVILSHGKNGLGGINAAGIANPTPPVANADEAANADNNTTFVSHTPSPAEAAGGYFDDRLIWLSTPILFNRLVQAGKLP